MGLQETLVQITSLLIENPNLTFLGTLIASAIIIIYDIEEGYSLNLPGRGQIGLGAGIALLGSGIWFFSRGGFEALLGQIAAGIFGGIFIGAILSFYFSRN